MAVYSLRDVAIESGLSYHAAYYYLKEGLFSEAYTVGSRQRVFTESDLETLKQIVNLRKSGKSISYIKKILQGEPVND